MFTTDDLCKDILIDGHISPFWYMHCRSEQHRSEQHRSKHHRSKQCMYVCMFSTADLEIKNVPNPLRRYSPNNVDLDTDNFVDFDDFVAFIRNCQKMSENCPNVSKSVRT